MLPEHIDPANAFIRDLTAEEQYNIMEEWFRKTFEVRHSALRTNPLKADTSGFGAVLMMRAMSLKANFKALFLRK
jgi:hypothetical protein